MCDLYWRDEIAHFYIWWKVSFCFYIGQDILVIDIHLCITFSIHVTLFGILKDIIICTRKYILWHLCICFWNILSIPDLCELSYYLESCRGTITESRDILPYTGQHSHCVYKDNFFFSKSLPVKVVNSNSYNNFQWIITILSEVCVPEAWRHSSTVNFHWWTCYTEVQTFIESRHICCSASKISRPYIHACSLPVPSVEGHMISRPFHSGYLPKQPSSTQNLQLRTNYSLQPISVCARSVSPKFIVHSATSYKQRK